MTASSGRRLTILYGLAYFHRYNGAQRGLHMIAQAMRDRGHHAIFLVTGEGRATAALRRDGFDVRRLPVVPELNRFGRSVSQGGVVAKLRVSAGLLSGLLPRARPSAPVVCAAAGLGMLTALAAVSLAWTESAERTVPEIARGLHVVGSCFSSA